MKKLIHGLMLFSVLAISNVSFAGEQLFCQASFPADGSVVRLWPTFRGAVGGLQRLNLPSYDLQCTHSQRPENALECHAPQGRTFLVSQDLTRGVWLGTVKNTEFNCYLIQRGPGTPGGPGVPGGNQPGETPAHPAPSNPAPCQGPGC